jgi:hypothetical protein
VSEISFNCLLLLYLFRTSPFITFAFVLTMRYQTTAAFALAVLQSAQTCGIHGDLDPRGDNLTRRIPVPEPSTKKALLINAKTIDGHKVRLAGHVAVDGGVIGPMLLTQMK